MILYFYDCSSGDRLLIRREKRVEFDGEEKEKSYFVALIYDSALVSLQRRRHGWNIVERTV